MPVGHIFLQETSTVGHTLTNKLYNLNGNLKFGNDFILKSNNPQGILSFDNGSQPVSLNLTNLTISNGNLSVNEDLSINGGTITSSTLTNSTFTGTVSGIIKSMVGLGNVNNTSDANKPISSATQTALNLKAPLENPTFTGNVGIGVTNPSEKLDVNGTVKATSFNGNLIDGCTATTQSAEDNSLKIATTAFVNTAVSDLVDSAPGTLDTLNELAASLGDDPNYATTITGLLANKAPLANPTFTGTINGITKSMVGLSNVDNTSDTNKPISSATQTALDLKAPLANPIFTGTVNVNNVLIKDNVTSGTSAYKRIEMTGGNSNAYIFGSFGQLGDGVHYTYNAFRENDNSNWYIPNNAGYTSLFSIGYGTFSFKNGGIGADPTNSVLEIASNGNVGIGVTNPNTILELGLDYTTENTFNHHISWKNTNTNAWDWSCGPYINNNKTKWSIRGGSNNPPNDLNDIITISSSTNGDNVGIGTTIPSQKLEVNGKIYTNTELIVGHEDNCYTYLAKGNNNTRGFLAVGSNASNTLGDSNSLNYGFKFVYRSDGGDFKLVRHNNSTTGSDVLTIHRSNGNVGIGIEPHADTKLHVDGYTLIGPANTNATSDNVKLSVNSGRFNVRYDSSTVKDHIYINNANSSGTGETGIIFRNYMKNMAMRMNFAGDFNFGIPSTILDGAISDPHLIIKNNGSVGIGTTSPSYKLSIGQDGNNTLLEIGRNNNFNHQYHFGGWFSAAHATANRFTSSFNMHVDSSAAGSIYMNLYSGKQTRIYQFFNASDRRIKKNFIPYNDNDLLNAIMNLEITTYQYKDLRFGCQNNNQQIGFIADSLENNSYFKYAFKLSNYNIPYDNFIEMQYTINYDNTIITVSNYIFDTNIIYYWYAYTENCEEDQTYDCDGYKFRTIQVKPLSSNSFENTFPSKEDGTKIIYKKILLIGEYGNNCKNVSKEKLVSGSYAGIQILNRKIQNLETKNIQLENKNNQLETHVIEQKNKISNLESQLENVLNRLLILENN
jgi:hypothetical protein